MALDNAAADAQVELILTDLGLNDAQKTIARPKWQAVVRRIYTGIPPNAVVAGTASNVQPGVGTAPVVGTIS